MNQSTHCETNVSPKPKRDGRPACSTQGRATAADATESGHLLIVDDDQAMCEFLEGILRPHHRVVWRTSALDGLQLVASEDFDLILTDLDMTEMRGLELCERILDVRRDIPIIVVTGHGSLAAATGAIRAGVHDFVTKPVDANRLIVIVNRALRQRRLQEEVKRLRRETAEPEGFGGIIGRSPAMRRVFELIDRVSGTDATVLITGETGTGKELVARAIHAQSARRKGPFVAVNCAAMPATLLESELFGHVRGSFTDASATRKGLFVEASGGTIFLDEIGELPLELQPKLLRSLQERKVRPIGSNHEVKFDARLITATNRNLETEVYEKRFREDLYYRINIVNLDVPPLRKRGADILGLAHYFTVRAAGRTGKRDVKGISAAAAEKLMTYDWPGNVRELENCLERAVALIRFDSVMVDDLPEKVRGHPVDRFVKSLGKPLELVTAEEMEARYIRQVMAMTGGNKTRVAKILGVNRRTLYVKLKRMSADAAARE